MSTARRVVDGQGARKADLAAIHIAKASLGLQEDEYRDLMATVCGGVRSAGELDFGGRKRFLAHLQACLKARGLAVRHTPVEKRQALSGPQRLMWSLWMRLADAGQVDHRTMAALEAFAKRQTGVDRIGWLTKAQEDLVIISLKEWLKRGGDDPGRAA